MWCLAERVSKRRFQPASRNQWGGSSVDMVRKQHNGTEEADSLVSSQLRASRIRELPLDYVPNPEFDTPNARKRILCPTPKPDQKSRHVRRPSGLPPYLASLYEVPLLTREQEAHLFRKYN